MSEEIDVVEKKGKFRCRGCDYTSDEKWDRQRCPGCGGWWNIVKPKAAVTAQITTFSSFKPPDRIPTFEPFDRVLGPTTGPDGRPVGVSGLVPSYTVLLAAPKGTGKSTLCLQIVKSYVETHKKPAIIASGEESLDVITGRAYRLGYTDEHGKLVKILGNEGNVEKIIEEIEARKAKLIVIDSLQTADVEYVDAGEGSTYQVNAVIQKLNWYAKKEKINLIVINQLNKQGDFAGSESAKHHVDVLMMLDYVDDPDTEKLEDSKYRELHIYENKNREGHTNVSSYMEMTPNGLVPTVLSKRLLLAKEGGWSREDVEEEEDKPRHRGRMKLVRLEGEDE